MKTTWRIREDVRLLLTMVFVVLLVLVPDARGAALYVGNGGDYATIGSALNDAGRGDTVYVYAGEYNENVILKSGVDVIGQGADVTTVIGQPTFGAPPMVVVANSIANAQFKGFTLTLASPLIGSRGFYVAGGSPVITENVVREVDTGITLSGGSTAVVRNNVFCPANQGTTGISLDLAPADVRNNIVINYVTGISAVVGDYPPSINYNDVYNCPTAYSGAGPGFGALAEDPLFVGPSANDFHLRRESPCIDAGDPSDPVPAQGGMRIDMGAFEYVLPAIVEGPVATVLGSDQAEIVWQTNVPADSLVSYGTKASSDREEADPLPVEVHHLLLTGLVPGSTYQYVAASTDEDGNEVASVIKYFETPGLPDSEPPSVEVEEVARVITIPTALKVTAHDNVEVERLEFSVDGVLQYTVYGSEFDWMIDPSLFENGSHLLRVAAYDAAGGMTIQEIPADFYVRPLDVSPPMAGISQPQAGVTVSGGQVSVTAWAMDDESGIDRLVFSFDGEQLHVARLDGEPGTAEEVTYLWNSHGVEDGDDHIIEVEAYNNDGLRIASEITVSVDNPLDIIEEFPDVLFGYGFIKLTRGQVKRDGVYYEAKLYVQNISSNAILTDVVVVDEHAGFQAVQSDYGYAPRVRYNSSKQSSLVTYQIGNLMPGEIKECTIDMATVLVVPDPGAFSYAIGKETTVFFDWEAEADTFSYSLVYHVPAVKVIDGWWGTTELPLNTATVLDPVKERDYLVVTHPGNLYTLYDDGEVNDLLSELPGFVRHKNGVIGYLRSPAAQSEFLNQISNDYVMTVSGVVHAGGWSFRLHPNWRTSGYMLIVGEKEVVPTFTIIATLSTGSVYEVPLSDQIYEDRNNDGYVDLTLGRIIGNSAADLIIPIQTSLGVFYGHPGYSFDTSNGLLISGVGNYYTSFVDNIDSISQTINTSSNPPLLPEIFHTKHYVVVGSFGVSLDDGDDLALADLGPGVTADRIIVADSSDDRIRILTSSGIQNYEFYVDFDPGDEMAVGDVIGGDNGRPEIIIADKSADTINVYQCYVALSPPSYTWVVSHEGTISMSLDSDDRLAAGDIEGDTLEEIVVSRTDYGNFRVASHLAGSVFSVSTLPGTYDGEHVLAVGDVVAGGKDEIVLAEYGMFLSGNYIYIYDEYGNQLYKVPRTISSGDQLDVADMLGNSYEDILLFDASKNVIYTFYENSSHALFADPHHTPINLPLDPDDLFAVGQLDYDDLEMVIGSIWGNYVYYYNNDLSTRFQAAFLDKVQGKDVVHFSGHGGPAGFGGVVDTGMFPLDAGGVNPFVFAAACSTGDYESDGDVSIAESFLANGAGIFIGSTRMSNTGKNNAAGLTFYRDYWRPWYAIGRPFRDLQRYLWSQGESWWRWSLEYNLYGDPKYERNGGDFAALVQAGTEGAETGGEPLPGLSIEIPAYEVTGIDGVDHVTIPGGMMLAEPGRYEVPFWLEEISIPAGYELQDVSLVSRSGLVVEAGLNLPLVPDDYMEVDDGPSFEPASSLWYPEGPFRWSVIPGEEGGRTLMLMVYPFSINSQTGESLFYANHQFSFFYGETAVEMTRFHLQHEVVSPNSQVEGFVEMKNGGSDDVRVRLRAEVISYAGTSSTDGLPLHSLTLTPGYTALTLAWSTEGREEGQYKIKVTLEDTDGNGLGSSAQTFVIDASAWVCPGDFEPDGDVDGSDLGAFARAGDYYMMEEFAGMFGSVCQ